MEGWAAGAAVTLGAPLPATQVRHLVPAATLALYRGEVVAVRSDGGAGSGALRYAKVAQSVLPSGGGVHTVSVHVEEGVAKRVLST